MTHEAVFQVEKVIIPSLIGGTITEGFTDKDKEFFGFTVKKGEKTIEDEGRKVKKPCNSN